jgi:hypothetical protein
MIRAHTCVAFTLLALLSGCVQSLHPYYTEAQLTYDPALEGKWAGEDQKVSVVLTGDAEAKSYQALYTDEENKTGKFDVRLAKVNGQLLLDITPAEPERENESDMYQVHLLPVHSFMLLTRAEGDKDSFQVRVMDYDWLKEYLEKNPNAVAHEKVGDKRILLTAASEKLQAFVLEHVNTAKAYGETTTFKRVTEATTPAPNP